MVTEFGMSKALGPVRYAGPAGSGYLGGQAATRNLSPEIENLIDTEMRRLLDDAEATALELIRTHEAALNEIARVLQEDEVIDGETVARIVAEEPVEGA
jgi:cell division protease FtsH